MANVISFMNPYPKMTVQPALIPNPTGTTRSCHVISFPRVGSAVGSGSVTESSATGGGIGAFVLRPPVAKNDNQRLRVVRLSKRINIF